MSADGRWTMVVEMPTGPQSADVDITTNGDAFTGTAVLNGESTPIEGTVDGDHIAWKVPITKPMKLTLSFEATITGDALAGTAKAGMFPKAKLTGTRA